MNERPRILERITQWRGSFLRSEIIRFRSARGTEHRWEAFHRVGSDGIVVIVPFTADGRVLLTKQYRPPLDRFVVEFPAGLNDKDEPLDRVAERELLEETGCRASAVRFLGEGPLSAGASGEVLSLFVADGIVCSGEQKLDATEEIEVIVLPVKGFHERLYTLADADTLIDLKVPGLFEVARRSSQLFA